MLIFFIFGRSDPFRFEHESGPIMLGRKPNAACALYVLQDKYVSANQLIVEELPSNKVRLKNFSGRVPIEFADRNKIEPGGMVELPLPVRVTAGTTLIEIHSGKEEKIDPSSFRSIAKPRSYHTLSIPIATSIFLGDAPTAEQITIWFETVVSVLRSAASSARFYQEIAEAVVKLIGLDCGMFILRNGTGWETRARYTTDDATRIDFSRMILDQVCQRRETIYQDDGKFDGTESLIGMHTVVASPVLDADGETVIGVVYGAKLQRGGLVSSKIREMHAHLVQVLATAAASGMARVDSETEASRRRVQFEQFFSPKLASMLDDDPEMLAGHDREVTILVSDVRGFSRIAERLGPRATCDMMGDILERLTMRIHEQDGSVVDYVGDGILSMWNAPMIQPDHAARACRAARGMLDELVGLNERWGSRIATTLELGIGINTGEALVGNTGSRQRMKYGALGNTVNVASRVEGATKILGVPILITGATHSQLPPSFATRRLCRVRAVGIETPITLHELHGESAPYDWIIDRDAYEAALNHFEQGELPETIRALFGLLSTHPGRYDKSALTLVARSVEALRSGVTPFDPVIALDSK